MKSSSAFRFPGAVASWRCPASIRYPSGNWVPFRELRARGFKILLNSPLLSNSVKAFKQLTSTVLTHRFTSGFRIQGEHFLIQPLYHQLRNRPYLFSSFLACRKSEWVQGAERYLFLREVFEIMLAKLTRSSAEPEDPTIAIHRLLCLLETVVDQQAYLIEEMMEPEAHGHINPIP